MPKMSALLCQPLLLLYVFACGNVAAQQPAASQPATGQAAATAPAKTQSATAAKKPATAAKAAPAVTLKTLKEKESYAMGMSFGTGLHRQGIALDPALVARGMRDAMAGSKTLLTEDEARAALRQLQGDVSQRMDAKAKEEGAANRKEGEAFLAANKGKEGVTTLPDGLQYKILKAGSGAKPSPTDTVTCNYRGTLLNGKEFDSSYKRGQPASFPLNGVIKGWTEALQLMPVGSKWQLFIPADMAYGDHAPSAEIAPGDTLIFEVELISIGEQKK